MMDINLRTPLCYCSSSGNCCSQQTSESGRGGSLWNSLQDNQQVSKSGVKRQDSRSGGLQRQESRTGSLKRQESRTGSLKRQDSRTGSLKRQESKNGGLTQQDSRKGLQRSNSRTGAVTEREPYTGGNNWKVGALFSLASIVTTLLLPNLVNILPRILCGEPPPVKQCQCGRGALPAAGQASLSISQTSWTFPCPPLQGQAEPGGRLHPCQEDQ